MRSCLDVYYIFNTGCETTETPPSSGCGPGCIAGRYSPCSFIHCVCVFESLPVKEGGRERVHCTFESVKKTRSLIFL